MQVLRECGLATGMLLSPSVLTAAAGEESSMDSDDEASTDRTAVSPVPGCKFGTFCVLTYVALHSNTMSSEISSLEASGDWILNEKH